MAYIQQRESLVVRRESSVESTRIEDFSKLFKRFLFFIQKNRVASRRVLEKSTILVDLMLGLG